VLGLLEKKVPESTAEASECGDLGADLRRETVNQNVKDLALILIVGRVSDGRDRLRHQILDHG